MGNPEKRNRNLYCQYHQDHGHTTEDCRSLWDHLDQLAREGKLKQLLHHTSGLGGQTTSQSKREIPPRPSSGNYQCYFCGAWQNRIVPI